MSHSSYTASERRGVLAIAIIALLVIGFGLGLSLCSGGVDAQQEIPSVIAHPEFVDSTFLKQKEEIKVKKKAKKGVKKSFEKRKTDKTYRRRSPLDEPV